MQKFTINFLNQASDTLILLMIVNNRRSKLHPYSPLSQRLEKIASKLYEEEYNNKFISINKIKE